MRDDRERGWRSDSDRTKEAQHFTSCLGLGAHPRVHLIEEREGLIRYLAAPGLVGLVDLVDDGVEPRLELRGRYGAVREGLELVPDVLSESHGAAPGR